MPTRFTTTPRVCRFILLLLLVACARLTFAAPDLEQGFRQPPNSARPWVYWFWLNGNLSREGITADLEAMQRVGIGGVLIMEVDQGAPKGDADFGGAKWRGLFKHVLAEAHRLGLQVNMNNDAGWCGSGGPWITPELAMQKLVWTNVDVKGPSKFDQSLPQPQSVANYYKDVVVFAFPKTGSYRIDSIQGKSAFIPQHAQPQPLTFPTVEKPDVIDQNQIVQLTAKMGADGHLTWDVPAGQWTILRMGHTPTGKDNHPAPEPGRGLESDKLSKKATEVMFDGLMKKNHHRLTGACSERPRFNSHRQLGNRLTKLVAAVPRGFQTAPRIRSAALFACRHRPRRGQPREFGTISMGPAPNRFRFSD